MAVDITTIGIEYDTSGLDKGTRAQDKTRESANKLGDSVDKTEKSFSSLNKILGIAASAMAAVGGVMLAKQFTETADAVSLMDARLKMATGSLEDFKQAQKDIYSISQQNNVGIKETTSLYTKLSDPVRRLGGTSKEVAAIVDSFATSLRVGGASAQEASAATLQFAQAMGSGRLQGDEFRSIAEASPRFMKALADGMGVPIEKLKELGSEGKLTADIVGNSLVKSLDQLKKEAAGLPDTVSGAITRFKNDVILAVGEISNSQGFTVGFAGLIEQARGLIPVIKDEVMGAFVAVNGWIERNKEEIGKVWEVAKGIVGDVWEVAKGAASVVGFIYEWATQSGLVKTSFETIRLLIAGFQDGVTAIGAGFAYVGSQIFQAVLAPLQFVLETSAKIAGVFDDKMAANIRAVGKDIDDFAKSGQNYAKGVTEEFAKGNSAVGRLNEELSKSKDSTKEVQKAATAAGGEFKKLTSTITDTGKAAKKLSTEQQAAQSIREQSAKLERNLMKSIDKEAESYAKDQIARTKEIAKSVVDSYTDQARAYLSVDKSLDDHAQRMNDLNTLAQLEIDTLGMSSVQRNTLIEQKKIELALNRQLLEIENSKTDQASKNILIDKAITQANIDKSTAELRAQQGEWSKFYGEIYNGLSDSLYRGFEAGKGFGQSFIDSLKNMLKANVLKISVQAVMDTGMSFLGGQSKPQEGQSGGGGLSSILSMFGGGGSSSGAGSAAATIKGYASTIGVAMAMYSIGRSIAGDYKIGGMNSTFSTLIGGGVGARLFGMADKQMGGQTVTGSLGTDNLMRNQAWTQDGGLFRSDRSGTWSYGLNNSVATTADGKSYTDTKNLESDKQLLQVLNDSYANVKAITTDFAKTLGLNAESIAARKDAINLTLGKTQEETNTAIGKVFEDISNTIASSLSPAIASFSKAGESAADTLARLAGSLTDVNAVIGAAGLKKFDTSVEGGAQASQLADLAGGIQKLSTGTQFFFENFLNDAEKIKPSIDQVAATMARLGMSNVKTIEDFKLAIKGGEDASGKLVQGLDLTTESGAKMYAELIAIAPQFKAVADYVTETTKAVEDNTAALQRAKQIEDERKSLQDEYNQLTMTSTQLYELYKNGLDESNRALADSIQAIKLKSTEEAAAAAKLAEEQNKANAIASERSSIQNEINQLTMTSAQLLDLQRNGLNEANKSLFDFLQATKEKIATEKQLSDIQKSIDDQRFSLMSEYNELTMTNEQRLQAQRFAIDQSNVALYDQIVALKDKNKADAESAAAAKVIADQRKSLQDEYNNLTMTEAQLLDLRRSTYDAANRDLFDAIQAEKATRAKALEDQKAYNDSIAELQRQAQAIAAERASLQDEYNQLTMTEIQLMELKRSTLNESNRDLFDLIQAEKLRRSEAAKAEEAAKNSQSEWAQAMKDAYDSQKSILSDIVSEFGSLLKSLKDFGRNLTTGDLSKASPEDKYKLLGAEVAGLIPKVQSGDKKAIADFMDVADEYLKASEDYNALNTQYFKDKDYIKKYIDEAAAYAQGQVDVATLQLNALNGNISATKAVNQSVQQLIQAVTGGISGGSSGGSSGAMSALSGYASNVIQGVENLGGKQSLLDGALSGDPYGRRNLQKQLERWNMQGLKANDIDTILGKGWLDKFIEALGIPKGLFGDQINFKKYISQTMQQIPGFAKGGIASGLAMVGENGAELVNFKSPARVYNSNDTKSILGGNSESSKETNDLLKKQNALMEKLISKLEGASEKQIKAVGNVAQKIGVANANVKFEKAGT